MKKSDLKPGMVVEYANGEKRLVVIINNKLYLIGEYRFATLESFDDDLNCSTSPHLNIVKVYQPKEASSFSSLLERNNCVWERITEVTVTMEEIAEKFGINVEQLKIKK